MTRMNFAEAKARLSEVTNRVEAGETIEIVRRGKVAMRLVPADPPKKAIDVAALRERVMKQPMHELTGAQVIREMRDSGY